MDEYMLGILYTTNALVMMLVNTQKRMLCPNSHTMCPKKYSKIELVCPKSQYTEKSIPNIPGWSTTSGRNSKCRTMHTLTGNIAHNALHTGGRILDNGVNAY